MPVRGGWGLHLPRSGSLRLDGTCRSDPRTNRTDKRWRRDQTLPVSAG